MKKGQKAIVITLIAVAFLLMTVGLTTAFLYNYNSYCPNDVQIIDNESDVYFYIDMNDSYKAYEFKFSSKGNKDIVITSSENVVYSNDVFAEGMELGQTYEITARYIGENSGNNSEYSKAVTWKSYKIISSPVLEYVEEENIIQWNEVENAEYYEVYFNLKDRYEVYQTTSNKMDIQYLQGGQREFYVIAKSSDENFKQSKKSNTINKTIIHNFTPFFSVNYDQESKVITFKNREQITKINVYIGETAIEKIVNSSFDEGNGAYNYTINIKTIYQEGKSIGIAPADVDEYNIFTGEIQYISELDD